MLDVKMRWKMVREYRVVLKFRCIRYVFCVETRTVLWPFWRECDGSNSHNTVAAALEFAQQHSDFGSGFVVEEVAA